MRPTDGCLAPDLYLVLVRRDSSCGGRLHHRIHLSFSVSIPCGDLNQGSWLRACAWEKGGKLNGCYYAVSRDGHQREPLSISKVRGPLIAVRTSIQPVPEDRSA